MSWILGFLEFFLVNLIRNPSKAGQEFALGDYRIFNYFRGFIIISIFINRIVNVAPAENAVVITRKNRRRHLHTSMAFYSVELLLIAKTLILDAFFCPVA